MADDQQFCLRWNNFQTNFASQFKALRTEEDFVDVTLACEGKRIQAHKLVLSACSPYFKELFKGNPCKHPIVIMQDVDYEHLLSLVEFMYAGQVNVCENRLPAFLRTAESLQIRGLSAQSQNKLPQRSERKSTDLRPAPTLMENNPESGRDGAGEGKDDSRYLPSSKRLCLPTDTNFHQSTSYSDVPTTALIETKMEPMDYYSDGEVKSNMSHISSTDSHAKSGYSLQGVLDATANMSAQLTQLPEPSHETIQDLVGEMCKPQSLEMAPPHATPQPQPQQSGDSAKPHSLDPRPCPECGRIYSNISNLRQHIRLIHFPECITCPLCFKPFKNKLYLRRHVMSYHEINLPSQNDMRYKMNSTSKFTVKSDTVDNQTQKLTPSAIAALFSPSSSNQKLDGSHLYGDKTVPYFSELQRNAGNRTATEHEMVPFFSELHRNTGNRSVTEHELNVPTTL